jgi:type II secretory pathway pseudopilin PulG
MRGLAMRRPAMRQGGFGYLGLLFAIAFLGLMLAGTGELWHTTLTREREAELLFAGRQYAHAIAAYHAAAPDGVRRWPQRLADLLEDRRGPTPQRHLRRLYRDPFTGSTEWGLIRAGDGIVGVYSLGAGRPLKRHGFRADEEDFAGAASYRDWRFTARAGPPPAPSAAGK